MTIKEQHIEVSQSTQNIAANVRRKLQPEEIDWLLNKNQQRFIHSKVKRHPDNSGRSIIEQMNVDALRTLIRQESVIAVKQPEGHYQAQLPADYSYLLRDASVVTSDCVAVAPALTQVTQPVLVVPFPLSAKTAKPYYETWIMTIDGENISLVDIATAFSGAWAGVPSKLENFAFRDVVLWYIRNVKKIPVYWERFQDLYKPRSFLFPTKAAGQVVIDGGAVQAGGLTNAVYNYYNVAGERTVENRLTPSHLVGAIKDSPFFGSSIHSPISELIDNNLVVYGDARFIVSKVSLTYVKKPRPLSLSLGQDCELPEDYHQAICDLTVEYFKAMTADPNWEVKLRDNMQRSVTTNP